MSDAVVKRSHSLLDIEMELRAQRVRHTAYAVIAALGLAATGYIQPPQWRILAAISFGVVAMLACLWSMRRQTLDTSAMLLLWGMFINISSLMWISDGLRDATILTYPIILIVAGLVVRPRQFLILLVAMVLVLLGITLATEVLHWRTNMSGSGPWGLLRDVTLILLGSAYAVWVIVSDVRRTLASLTYLSTHDSLTGLPNRATGQDRIEQGLLHAGRRGTMVAVMFVDMDNFKAINDDLGHPAGDEFLQSIADRLTGVIRKSDLVARHGGDEFLIAMMDVTDLGAVGKIADKIMVQIAEPLSVQGTVIAASCSIGIALFPQDAPDYANLLRLSDIAMYQAKQAGRNTYQFYDAVLHTENQTSLQLIASMRNGLARGEFHVHYQPVFDLQSGALVGAEALVRWLHPELGMIAPGHFIGAAEKSGLIVELGEQVLESACAQMKQWNQQRRANGLSPLVIAVNLSPVQLRRGSLADVVHAVLHRTGLPAACLELEITESTLVEDNERFLASLQRLRALGVSIAIDDFGTGYSNLAYLQRFAVNKLKIDQSFVKAMVLGLQQRAIVTAIIQMAQSLRLQVHAEGIEDANARDALLILGCDLGQGYYFARPQSAVEFERLMPALTAQKSPAV
jgi:diguanylate cyclase (GGDEF)-like protein